MSISLFQHCQERTPVCSHCGKYEIFCKCENEELELELNWQQQLDDDSTSTGDPHGH